MADIRAVVITYNSEKTIGDCLDYLIRDRDVGVISEIYVVDNSSTDRTKHIIKTINSDIELIELNKNVGYGSACNIGAKFAKTKYLIFLNPDIVIPEGEISKMCSFLDNNNNVAIVGGWLSDESGVPNYSFRRFPSLRLALFHRESLLRALLGKIGITGGYITHLRAPERPIEVDWVLGAVMMVRRDVFELLGGFDEGFFLYQEDVDICWRTRLAGYKVYHLPDVRITHYFEHSTKRRPYLRVIAKHRSLYRFLKKADKLMPLNEVFIIPLFGLNIIFSITYEVIKSLLFSK
ncbi:MAG: glycosyltransferase family 2 protein [bacterium]